MRRFCLALSAILFLPSFALAQHNEQPGDPRPSAAPASSARGGAPTASATVIKRGPWTSVQVNIDRLGNNIKGDAANEPSIGIDPTDPKKIVIGWRQFDRTSSNFRKNGWSYSHDAGKTWSFPGSIQSTLFNSDPVIDTDKNGNFFYLSYPGGRVLRVFKSTTGGKSWTGPVTISGGDKAWMIVDKSKSIGNGNIYIIWQVAHGPNTFLRSTNGGVSFTGPTAVPSWPTFGVLDTDSAGNVYAAGLYRQSFGSFRLAVSSNAKDKTKSPSFTTRSVNMGGSMGWSRTPNPAGLAGQAYVRTDPSRKGYVYMLCSVDPSGSDPMDVHFVRSTNGGVSFGSPVRVNKDSRTNGAYQWFGTMSVSPTGRIDVVWNDTRGGNVRVSETYYSYSLDAGSTWSPDIPIGPAWTSTIGWPRQNKIGDYYDMRSDKAEAHLAYAATYNGEQDVYYTRLGDCNGNGVHDGVDIKNGTSFDNNKNGMPDTCETCAKDLGQAKGMKLTLCGDDLTKIGSTATLELTKAPAGGLVILGISTGRSSPPLPLPGGGFVPDLWTSPAILHTGYITDKTGRVGAAWKGGAKSVTTLYLQAVMLKGSGLVVSNALETKLGF